MSRQGILAEQVGFEPSVQIWDSADKRGSFELSLNVLHHWRK
jgi:hypothetical protein